MPEIFRNRIIRPSSRQEIGSERYKVDCKNVKTGDLLIVNIDHEAKKFTKTYKFIGEDLNEKNSIHFEVHEINNSVEISWTDAQPIH